MRHATTGLMLVALVTLPAHAQEDTAEGKMLYRNYCATCHGLTGEGAGPMGPALILQPTDLTTLQRDNDDVFPLLRVVKRIDGRDPLVGHGSPMPVFGPFFEGGRDIALRTQAGQSILTSHPVAEIISWMRSIQK